MTRFDHIIYIFNYLLLKIIKNLYFENTRRDKSKISFVNIYMYILVKIYDQSRSYE
jgi:hypothetical protein